MRLVIHATRSDILKINFLTVNALKFLNFLFFRIANREDPDQTASSEAVWSGSVLFV